MKTVTISRNKYRRRAPKLVHSSIKPKASISLTSISTSRNPTIVQQLADRSFLSYQTTYTSHQEMHLFIMIYPRSAESPKVRKKSSTFPHAEKTITLQHLNILQPKTSTERLACHQAPTEEQRKAVSFGEMGRAHWTKLGPSSKNSGRAYFPLLHRCAQSSFQWCTHNACKGEPHSDFGCIGDPHNPTCATTTSTPPTPYAFS